MTIEELSRFVYGIMYGDDEHRHSRVMNTWEGISIGVLNWTGYSAMSMLNHIIIRLGLIKSTFILGFKLRDMIVYYHGDLYTQDPDEGISTDDICKISKLISTKTGINIQDTYVLDKIKSHIESVIKDGIHNYGLIVLVTACYMNWINCLSDDIIAICRVYGRGYNVDIPYIESKLLPIFDRAGARGKNMKNLFYKIYSIPDSDLYL